MSKHLNLDERLRVPYSIGTGIPKGGDAEIEGYLQSLRTQGFCVIERVIPEDQVDAVRENVHRGRELLQQDREAERRKRIELERHRDPDAEIDDSHERFERWRSDPVRPPLAPLSELCDIAQCETFAECLAEPRVLRVARAMLDGVRKNRFVQLIGAYNWFIYYANRLVPSVVRAIIDGDLRKGLKADSGA